MGIKIRHARATDYGQVMRLYGEFVKDQARFAGKGNDSYRKVLKSRTATLDLAVDGRNILGFVSYSIRSVVRYPRPILEVEEFFVSDEYRRRGIGSMLMKHILRIAKKKKCAYVFLASGKDRTGAHAFYKNFGFTEYAFHYRRKP